MLCDSFLQMLEDLLLCSVETVVSAPLVCHCRGLMKVSRSQGGWGIYTDTLMLLQWSSWLLPYIYFSTFLCCFLRFFLSKLLFLSHFVMGSLNWFAVFTAKNSCWTYITNSSIFLCVLTAYLHVTTSVLFYCFSSLCCFWQLWVFWKNK